MLSNDHVRLTTTLALVLALFQTAEAAAPGRADPRSGGRTPVLSCVTYGPTGLRGVGPSDAQRSLLASTSYDAIPRKEEP
jgi:hypothetical protein